MDEAVDAPEVETFEEEATESGGVVDEFKNNLGSALAAALPSAAAVASSMLARGVQDYKSPVVLNPTERVVAALTGNAAAEASFMTAAAKYLDDQRMGLRPGRVEEERKALKEINAAKKLLQGQDLTEPTVAAMRTLATLTTATGEWLWG